MMEPIQDEREFILCMQALLRLEAELGGRFMVELKGPIWEHCLTLRLLLRRYLDSDLRLTAFACKRQGVATPHPNNLYGVGVSVNGGTVTIAADTQLLTLAEAANLSAWLRVVVENQPGGEELVEKAYYAANE